MTIAIRDEILAYLRTGPKTVVQVADHFAMKAHTSRNHLNRLVDRSMATAKTIRTGRQGGCYAYEAKP